MTDPGARSRKPPASGSTCWSRGDPRRAPRGASGTSLVGQAPTMRSALSRPLAPRASAQPQSSYRGAAGGMSRAARRRPSGRARAPGSLLAAVSRAAPATAPNSRDLSELMLDPHEAQSPRDRDRGGVPGDFRLHLRRAPTTLETLGTARRGYFVERPWAARSSRFPARRSGSAACPGRMAHCSSSPATDPANPYGANPALSEARMTAPSRHAPPLRLTVLRAGKPGDRMLYVESSAGVSRGKLPSITELDGEQNGAGARRDSPRPICMSGVHRAPCDRTRTRVEAVSAAEP